MMVFIMKVDLNYTRCYWFVHLWPHLKHLALVLDKSCASHDLL